ncbi:hypothetical protein FRB95_014251 [Tulasnella sp. JGI-2019a]|nr:hypothetical protein FRB95_014251 [Tulasnella sp. JGI-2019a]
MAQITIAYPAHILTRPVLICKRFVMIMAIQLELVHNRPVSLRDAAWLAVAVVMEAGNMTCMIMLIWVTSLGDSTGFLMISSVCLWFLSISFDFELWLVRCGYTEAVEVRRAEGDERINDRDWTRERSMMSCTLDSSFICFVFYLYSTPEALDPLNL